MVCALGLLSGGLGFKSSSLPKEMDLRSVVTNSTPPRVVNSELVSLLPVGVLTRAFSQSTFSSYAYKKTKMVSS